MSNLDSIAPSSNHFPTHEFAPKSPKRRRGRKWLLVILILVIGLGIGGYKLISRANQIFTKKQNIFQRIGNFFISPDKPLIGEEEGRINVLLMGVGGNGHEGSYLTDTMIVASINTKTNEVV